MNHLKFSLSAKGIEIIQVRNVLPSENDMRVFMPEFNRGREDAIGVFLLPAQIISFYKRAMEMRLKLQTFNADIIGSESIIRDCPENINGAFFTEVGVTSEFRNIYNEEFKSEGHIGHAAQAFDVANLVADLFGNLGNKISSDDIIKVISDISSRKGATGEFRFSDTADSGKELRMPVAMKVIRDKKIETILEDMAF